MGPILDIGLLIARERHGSTIEDVLRQARATHGEVDVALSAIRVVELTHGIYRAKSDADRKGRRAYADQVFHTLLVHPATFETAQLAGRIKGEQSALGNVIAFEDFVIGATALHLGFEVATLNINHFERVPDLEIVAL